MPALHRVADMTLTITIAHDALASRAVAVPGAPPRTAIRRTLGAGPPLMGAAARLRAAALDPGVAVDEVLGLARGVATAVAGVTGDGPPAPAADRSLSWQRPRRLGLVRPGLGTSLGVSQ